jgi:uncharacterized protein (TIGR03437 family)
MKVRPSAVIFALVLAGAHVAGAATTVWAFNASFGNPHIQAYDLVTGKTVADFIAPNKDAQRGRANGRGIAVVGTTIYYTLADTPNVYKTDAVTQADLGIAFTTVLTPGINSLAWDGASFWMVASQPSNPNLLADDKVYQYSLNGIPGRTLVLALPPNTNQARNGIEVTPFGIVANQGSVPYDLFDLNGNLTHPFLITATFRTTGIAFDGVNYIVADVVNQQLAIFDQAGTFLRFVPLGGANGAVLDCKTENCIVDLAVAVSTQPAVAPQFLITGVAQAASYVPGAIAPGEIMTIFGSGMGPVTPALLQLNASGLVGSSVAGTRVLFDGVPAPVIYTSNQQLSVVVPYAVAAKPSVSVVVEYAGIASAPVPVPVIPSAPGIFTANGSGTGPGAILNQDGITLNSAANPAGKGTVVAIFATGEGQTNPAGVDGQLAAAGLPKPLLPVSVEIGGVAADVLYAGAAPTLVAGLLQVNVRIPANAPSGSAPVLLHVGNGTSQAGVTLAIQ